MSEREENPDHLCQSCGGSGRVRSGIKGARTISCPMCGASFRVYGADQVFHGRVEGESAAEVSKVIKAMLASQKAQPMKITISDSTIGMLNTGEMKDIQSISVHLENLNNAGSHEVAEALKHVTEAVLASEALPSDKRSEVLDQLQALSEQATLAPEKRSKRGVLGAVFSTLATTLSGAGGLAEVWSTWGAAIRSYFGF